jgi:hypothetical protein
VCYVGNRNHTQHKPPRVLPPGDAVGSPPQRPSLFKGVQVLQDDDQNSTDLMKCIHSLQEKEKLDGIDVRRRTISIQDNTDGDFQFLPLLGPFNRIFLKLSFRLLMMSSCSVACLDGLTRPSTHYHFCTSFVKAGVVFSP